MTYLKDSYQRFLANPRNAPLAANASLIYVPTTTKVEGAGAIATHTSRQASIVKKNSERIINAIESSDALCLDMETTLEFVEGGGAYLPSLDDNFLADRVVTFPTIHIVHFNAEQQIQQVRIYWDQASLLKEVEVIGARGRSWPIRPAKEQVRLLKSAIEEKSAAPVLNPSSEDKNERPPRPASPGKRHIKDPYAADSLFDLLSPEKGDGVTEHNDAPRPSSPGKRYTRDPYAAASLTELLSPSKDDAAPPRPYAPASAQPAPRQYGELFIGDEDEAPSTPSKSEKVVAPRGGSKFQGSRIFEDDEPADERAPYKTNPLKFNHFEIGGDNADREVKTQQPQRKFRNQSQWDFGDFATPQKNTEEARGFGYSDDNAEAESPPARPAVHKPRRDADVHFDMTDDNDDEDDGRLISSYENRGKGLYEDRLFNEDGTPKGTGEEKTKPDALGVTGNNVSRSKDFDPHWEMTDVSPVPTSRHTPKPLAMDRAKALQMMESSWDNYDQSPEPIRTATSLHNPSRHNQPSWTMGDE
ncbi:hypothetical protein F1880_007834 [Penicillium rolfsii]|nr:hypothetical protein F1880_007834 [Penicillium rolfsii]